MADNLALTVTGSDGTVYAITGTLTNSTVVKTSPVIVPPPPPPVTTGAPVIPSTSKTINMLTPLKPWQMNHDLGTPGTVPAITTTYPVTAPDGTQNCRQFAFTTTGKAGAIYHANAVPSGASAFTRFAYRKREMYLKAIPTNCETDLEITGQATGVPYDMAMQQDGYSGVEDITINHKWTGTGIKVNPTTRKTGVWYESVEYVGFDPVAKQITYFGVTLDDGVFYPINQVVADADNAVWAKDEVNFQLQWDSGQTASTDYVILCSALEVTPW
jgi:hypothetical protein